MSRVSSTVVLLLFSTAIFMIISNFNNSCEDNQDGNVAIKYNDGFYKDRILEVYSIGPINYIRHISNVEDIDLSKKANSYFLDLRTDELYIKNFNEKESLKFDVKVSKLKSINTVSEIIQKSYLLRIIYSDSDRVNYPPNPQILLSEFRRLLRDNTDAWFLQQRGNQFILQSLGFYKSYFFIRDPNKNMGDLIEIDREIDKRNIDHNTIRLKIPKVTVFRFLTDNP